VPQSSTLNFKYQLAQQLKANIRLLSYTGADLFSWKLVPPVPDGFYDRIINDWLNDGRRRTEIMAYIIDSKSIL